MEEQTNKAPKDFVFLGLDMPKITLGYGLFLILWGIMVSLFSASSSITSFIPSLLGVPMCACGVIALKAPQKKKLIMHIAVLLGLLIFIGGIDFFRGFSTGEGAFANIWAGTSKLMLLTTGFAFCLLCIKSFMHARSQLDS